MAKTASLPNLAWIAFSGGGRKEGPKSSFRPSTGVLVCCWFGWLTDSACVYTAKCSFSPGNFLFFESHFVWFVCATEFWSDVSRKVWKVSVGLLVLVLFARAPSKELAYVVHWQGWHFGQGRSDWCPVRWSRTHLVWRQAQRLPISWSSRSCACDVPVFRAPMFCSSCQVPCCQKIWIFIKQTHSLWNTQISLRKLPLLCGREKRCSFWLIRWIVSFCTCL